MVRDNDSYLLKEAEISKTQTVGRLSAKGKDDLVGLIRQPTSSWFDSNNKQKAVFVLRTKVEKWLD